MRGEAQGAMGSIVTLHRWGWGVHLVTSHLRAGSSNPALCLGWPLSKSCLLLKLCPALDACSEDRLQSVCPSSRKLLQPMSRMSVRPALGTETLPGIKQMQ